MNPTQELYDALDLAYSHFNKSLFHGKLPPVLFTTQRQHGVMGYFAPERWAGTAGDTCHEIAINPSYVGRAALLEVFQTLVHEMVHCWQYVHGQPSRRGYHNKEWAKKMIAIGLMPSHTGQPGGKTVGQHMSDYPLKDGAFIRQCKTLVNTKKYQLPWVDRFAVIQTDVQSTPDEVSAALENIDHDTLIKLTTEMSALFDDNTIVDKPKSPTDRKKTCYQCADCGAKVWGKPALHIQCVSCDSPFAAIS